MASILLTINDETLLSQIRKVCSMIKGVSDVKIIKSRDITKTKGYREAMDDIKNGRIHHAKDVDDMFNQILG